MNNGYGMRAYAVESSTSTEETSSEQSVKQTTEATTTAQKESSSEASSSKPQSSSKTEPTTTTSSTKTTTTTEPETVETTPLQDPVKDIQDQLKRDATVPLDQTITDTMTVADIEPAMHSLDAAGDLDGFVKLDRNEPEEFPVNFETDRRYVYFFGPVSKTRKLDDKVVNSSVENDTLYQELVKPTDKLSTLFDISTAKNKFNYSLNANSFQMGIVLPDDSLISYAYNMKAKENSSDLGEEFGTIKNGYSIGEITTNPLLPSSIDLLPQISNQSGYVSEILNLYVNPQNHEMYAYTALIQVVNYKPVSIKGYVRVKISPDSNRGRVRMTTKYLNATSQSNKILYGYGLHIDINGQHTQSILKSLGGDLGAYFYQDASGLQDGQPYLLKLHTDGYKNQPTKMYVNNLYSQSIWTKSDGATAPNIAKDQAYSLTHPVIGFRWDTVTLAPLGTTEFNFDQSISTSNGYAVYVNYLDQDGNKIADGDLLESEVTGTAYTTKPKDIPGYQLISTPSNATGVFTVESIVVSYTYRALPTGVPKVQAIAVGDTLDKKKIDELFSDIKGEGTEIDTIATFDSSKIGFQWVEVTLKDKLGNISDPIKVPVNVLDAQTSASDLTNKIAINAEDLTYNPAQVKDAITNNALDTMLTKDSKVTAWDMADGTPYGVTLIGNNVKPAKGDYTADFLGTRNDQTGQITKQIKVTVGGELKFVNVPTEMNFNNSMIQSKVVYVGRQDDTWKIDIDNSLGTQWNLTAQATPLENQQKETVENALIFKDASGQEKILNSVTQEIAVGDISADAPTVTWAEKEGILLKILPGTVKKGTYQSEITWTLEDTPTAP